MTIAARATGAWVASRITPTPSASPRTELPVLLSRRSSGHGRSPGRRVDEAQRLDEALAGRHVHPAERPRGPRHLRAERRHEADVLGGGEAPLQLPQPLAQRGDVLLPTTHRNGGAVGVGTRELPNAGGELEAVLPLDDAQLAGSDLGEPRL